MTVESLKDCNKKTLARMARDQRIVGWHAMRKDQLIRALTNKASQAKAGTPAETEAKAKSQELANRRPKASRGRSAQASATRSASSSASRRSASAPPPRSLAPMTSRSLDHECDKDRIITMVRDSYWLHTYWELSRATLGRAQAALGQDWHTARPILRLMDVTSGDTTSATERHVRDIEVHGGVNNWYIDVTEPPRSFRVDVGYLSRKGKFYVLARSNVVSTPRAGVADVLDQNWEPIEQDYERIYHRSGGADHAGPSSDLRELFEERLRRSMSGLNLQTLGPGASGPVDREFHFEIDAELIVFGTTDPEAKLTLQGEPVQIRDDGSFTVRFSLPDARQIIPVTASSPDGIEERTVVLAIERNTKELEPMIHDGNDL